jgi:hypothetical protein
MSVIQAMVEVMQPAVQGLTNVAGGRTPGATNPGYVVADPACGTDDNLYLHGIGSASSRSVDKPRWDKSRTGDKSPSGDKYPITANDALLKAV